jgi:hypothetical protein
MNIETMDSAMQWIFGNILLIWICNICVLFYASCNEPIIKNQITRIEQLESQNRAISQALDKLDGGHTIPIRRDEIFGLRYEIASLTADLQKHKTDNLNRRRIIESSDDEDQ